MNSDWLLQVNKFFPPTVSLWSTNSLYHFVIEYLDIAHGGSGLYEKLIVLGHRALETFSEMYIYEQFDPTGIPSDLLGGREIPEEVSYSLYLQYFMKINLFRSLAQVGRENE